MEEIVEFVEAIWEEIDRLDYEHWTTDGIIEARLKFLAEMMLLGGRLAAPTREEWIGFNLMQRDGEL